MVQKQNNERLSLEEEETLEEGVVQDEQRALQEGIPGGAKSLQSNIQPVYPTWPVSSPGPWQTPPPPGTKSINALRSEQVVEVSYYQEAGRESTDNNSVRSLEDETMQYKEGEQQDNAERTLERHKKHR